MKNKLLFLLVVATILLSGCEDKENTYKMTLVTGEEITVTYGTCRVYNDGIGCWDEYNPVLVPDVFYLVSSFEEVE